MTILARFLSRYKLAQVTPAEERELIKALLGSSAANPLGTAVQGIISHGR